MTLLPYRIAVAALLCAGLIIAGGCAAAPVERSRQVDAPIPPDPEAITVFGRYQPSLESLAPAGVEIGDLATRDGRLVIHMQSETPRAAEAFQRALLRSGWYRDARREAVEDGTLREGEFVMSVQPAP